MNREAARHEAGHAVVSLALLGDVGLVRVDARGGGRTETPGYDAASVEDRAAVITAGLVAEALTMGDQQAALTAVSALMTGRPAKSSDGERLAEVLAGVPQHKRQDVARRGAIRAQKIILANVGLFQRMADQLERDGVMTGAQVDRWINPPKAKPTPATTWNDGPLPGRARSADGGRPMSPGELRTKASELDAQGYDMAARLMRQSAERMDGRRTAGQVRGQATMDRSLREVR